MRGMGRVGVTVGAILAISCSWVEAKGIVGTKERVSFEGLVGKHEQSPIPDGYDGFGWSGTISAIGKGLYRDQQGLHSVLRGKVAAANLDGNGLIGLDDRSKFSIHSGHFAAFGNAPAPVIFNAYLDGVLVGTVSMTLQPTDTLVQFDQTFAHIDRFEIDGHIVAFDNLHLSF